MVDVSTCTSTSRCGGMKVVSINFKYPHIMWTNPVNKTVMTRCGICV